MSALENKQIVVTASQLTDIPNAQNLASKLALPYVNAEEIKVYSWVLICDAGRLSLRFPGAAKPFTVDFTQPAYLHRLKQTSIAREPLARAVGLKSGSYLKVIDGTAGWGTDAMLLARLGARVTALERSSIVAALLTNGLQRAKQMPFFAELDISLNVIDTQDFLLHSVTQDAVLYLDPMFPERPNNALVKKPLQLLQNLLEENLVEVDELMNTALNTAYNRIVVKRPVWADSLIKIPNFSVPAGMIRFDVYLK